MKKEKEFIKRMGLNPHAREIKVEIQKGVRDFQLKSNLSVPHAYI